MTRKAKSLQGIQEAGARIAPAVALLLLSDPVSAGFTGDTEDGDLHVVPEPSTLGLLAAGVAVGGVVSYIRNKRGK